jgi:RND family efflux transporter MFP subunit
VPRKEIAIKPQISGIIEELYIEAGQVVKQGDLVAKVRVIPNMSSLSAAEARVNQAQIALENAARENERQKRLYAEGTVAQSVYQGAETAWKAATEELAAAKDNIDIVRKGASARVGSATNTLIRATIAGMVLQVPVEVGNSVIEANNFNDGTTIATLADMDDMIFKGKVDESEVGKIKPGMDLVLTVGAIDNKKIEATLERIAPKGVEENGAIQFEIRAAGEAAARRLPARQLQRQRRHRARQAHAGGGDPGGGAPVRRRQAVRRSRDQAADLREAADQDRALGRHPDRDRRGARRERQGEEPEHRLAEPRGNWGDGSAAPLIRSV